MWTLLVLAAAMNIEHKPVNCMIKGQFPVIEAVVQPADANVRLYFKAAPGGGEYFSVGMTADRDRLVARLPKPKAKPGKVTYYIEALAEDGTGTKTPAITAEVVEDVNRCPEKGLVAARGRSGDVQLSSTDASKNKPEGFDGVGDVTPGRPSKSPAAATEAATEARPTPPPPVSQEYQIGPEDILKIVVYGHDTLSQTVVVQPDGTFTFPLIGRVKASEMSPDELQRKLVVLLAKDFIRNPQVTVTVQEYRSKTVFVVGEIAKPGTYPLAGNATVIGILAKAGPTTVNAGSEVVIVRPLVATGGPLLPGDVSEEGQAKVLRVNIRDIEAGQLDKNVRLEANDTVFIPQAPTVFVSGEVRNPGAFAFRQGATVRQVVSLAGGFTERSSRKIRVVRDENGKNVETSIGLDDPVRPGDTIIVKAKLF
jgi:polysaccharide biosynthesis/export protein